MASRRAQWTWLVYMAGDNNLEGAGVDDLKEMQEVGSTSDVNVIVQFDTEENRTTRYRIEKNGLTTLKDMPGVDSGDPKILSDFIRWGFDSFPAEHYLLDIWNHGGGWENLPLDFDYNAIRAAQPKLASKLKRLKRSMFRTTVQKVYQRSAIAQSPSARAIAIDTSSHDYLDNQELRDALLNGVPGAAQIDILGCDACLMNMVEVAYEVRTAAKFMVGSQETEPGAGWPYASILAELTSNSDTPPADLASAIVRLYGEWFQKNGDPVRDRAATQSALNLSNIHLAADAVDELAKALVGGPPQLMGSVGLAQRAAQHFYYPEYIDLGDFARQISKRMADQPQAMAAAIKVGESVDTSRRDGFVIANATWGHSVQRAGGISIYFPDRQENYSPDYAELAFSRDGQWSKFLERFFQESSDDSKSGPVAPENVNRFPGLEVVSPPGSASAELPKAIVYIHGIGNQPAAAILKTEWDYALFGLDMGNKTSIAYWVNRDRYPSPTERSVADTDRMVIPPLGSRSADLKSEDIESLISGIGNGREAEVLRRIANRVTADDRATRLAPKMTGATPRILPLPMPLRQWITSHLTKLLLPDVRDFLFDSSRRAAMEAAFRSTLIDARTPVVVVAHSQGTMIAYDVLRQLKKDECKVALFVTMGSPLGIQEVQDELIQWSGGEPLAVPRCVSRWVNVADWLDPVAADDELADDFSPNGSIEDHHGVVNLDSPGAPHSATGYLRSDQVREAVNSTVGSEFVPTELVVAPS